MTESSPQPSRLRLLQPDALARLQRINLLARGLVEGMVVGKHQSPYKGFSVEFAEHRQYTPGDDIRDLDWRAFGKSDRYYIKQYIEETNLRTVLLVDSSASMTYAGNRAQKIEGKRLSKFAYAQYLAASLAYLMIHQQDAVGMVTFDSKIRRYVPPRSQANHLHVLLDELDKTKPSHETQLADIFHSIAEQIPRRGMVIILSDLFDDPDELLTALQHFRHRRHEVIVLHIMAEEELTFPFTHWSNFQDMESPQQEIELDPRSIRSAYLEQMRGFLDKISEGCGRMKIDYHRMPTSQPYEKTLGDYLAKRRGLG